jgi:threonine/homoserine/homoserine lactone efflux protein
MDMHQFLLFAFASLMLNLTPGNDMLYVISRSTGQGTRAGIVSSLGIMGGCLLHIVAAVAGISAIIARSAMAFDIIKYIGAGYLAYLGVRSLVDKTAVIRTSANSARIAFRKIFWQGALTNMLNPKVALFFLAFLPQFIDISTLHPQWKILVLGLWFDCSGTLINILVAVLFGRMGNWISRSRNFAKVQQKMTGFLLIALGIRIAFTSKK